MKTDVELNKEEVREAVQMYLENEKGISADPENISFDIGRRSSQPGQRGSPMLTSVTCEDVDKLGKNV